MKKILIATAAIAMIATSCSNNEIFEETQNVRNAIQFGVTTNKQTKADVISGLEFPIGKTFGVLAYHGDDVFMNNQDVERQSDKYDYSPIKYWPNDDSTVDFYAYYPYVSGETFTLASKVPTYTFTTAETVASQVDLMWATPATGKKKSDAAAVNFSFNHALVQLNFAAYAEAEYPNTVIKINSVQIKNVLPTGTLNLGTGVWTNVSGTVINPTPLSTEVTLATAAISKETATELNCATLLIPQPLTSVTLDVNYTVTTGEVSVDSNKSIALNSTTAWTAAKSLKYYLKIGLASISFTAEVANDWENIASGQELAAQ